MVDVQQTSPSLAELFNVISETLKELLQADRITLFILDGSSRALWTVVANLDFRIPVNQGIVGEVVTFQRTVNIPY
ncbi:MAG: hypothetical protein WCA35_13330, partial [Kovacikia sp.]